MSHQIIGQAFNMVTMLTNDLEAPFCLFVNNLFDRIVQFSLNFLTVLQFLTIFECDIADSITHAQFHHHACGHLAYFLEVILGSSGHCAIEFLFGASPSQGGTDLVLNFLLGL